MKNQTPPKQPPYEKSSSHRKSNLLTSQQKKLEHNKSMDLSWSRQSQSSNHRSPNKTEMIFPRQHSNKRKALPTSFVIQNMVKEITLQPLNPYWKQQSHSQLIDILADDSKYNRFLQSLEAPSVNQDVQYIQQILSILLCKVKQNNPSIKKQGQNFFIEFQKSIALQKQLRIDELKKQISTKQKQINDVQDSYKQIIKNYLDVLQELNKRNEFETNDIDRD